MLNKAYYFSLKMLKWNISIFKEVKEDFYCFVLSLTDFSPNLWVILVAFIFTGDLIFLFFNLFNTLFLFSLRHKWSGSAKVHKNMTELTICTNIRQTSGVFVGFFSPLHFNFPLKLYLNFKKLEGSQDSQNMPRTVKVCVLCWVTCTPQKFRCHLHSCKILRQAFKIYPSD